MNRNLSNPFPPKYQDYPKIPGRWNRWSHWPTAFSYQEDVAIKPSISIHFLVSIVLNSLDIFWSISTWFHMTPQNMGSQLCFLQLTKSRCRYSRSMTVQFSQGLSIRTSATSERTLEEAHPCRCNPKFCDAMPTLNPMFSGTKWWLHCN